MTMPGTMPRGGPATVQKVVHASSRKANYSMRHTAGRQRQCQGSSQPRSGRAGGRENLSQCRRIRKTCATCLSLACAHYADCHCLLSSLCCLLVCAASTQGSSSDDFAWHAIAWRPCYNSKVVHASMLPPSQGEPLGDGALQAANASARAVLHHPHPARYVGALSLCVARTRDSRRGQLAARSREPARARRISRDASNSLSSPAIYALCVVAK